MRLVRLGATRLGWFVAANTALLGLAAVIKSWNDIDDDDEEALRSYLAPWQENSQLLMWRTKDGNLAYFDGSFLVPYDVISSPFRKLWRDIKDPDIGAGETALDFFKETMDPVAKEQILAGAIMDSMRGVEVSGRKVWDQSDPSATKVVAGLRHIWNQALEPGVITSGRRIMKGWNEEVSSTGRQYDLRQELYGNLLGLRMQTLNLETGLAVSGRKFQFDIRDGSSKFTKAFQSAGTQSDRNILRGFRLANEARERTYRGLAKKVRAARNLGMPESQIITILRGDRLVPEAAIRDILNNRYTRYEPTTSVLKRAQANGTKHGQDRVALWRHAREQWPEVKPLLQDEPATE